MSEWTRHLKRYVKAQNLTALEVSWQLHVSSSVVHYWLHGATPRFEMRKKIETWSKGQIPAEESAA